jgi:amidase
MDRSLTVPYSLVPVVVPPGQPAFPTGFEPRPAPFNVSFTGTACSEPKLIALAYAFEQATKKRIASALFP